MANIQDKFKNEVVGSSGEIYDYKNTISSYGDFKRLRGIDVILSSWRNILLTQIRSYNHDPEYGSELYSYIFEPADDFTKDGIKEELAYRLMQYDDRARITNVEIKFLRGDRKGFSVKATVNYKGEKGEFKTTISEDLYGEI